MLFMKGIIAQVSVDGFKEVSEMGPINGLLVSIILILAGVTVFLFRKYEERNQVIKELQDKAVLREEERSREFLESEKETLKVLGGVTHVLEMLEKVNDQDTVNIMNKIADEASMVKEVINSLEKTISAKIENKLNK